MTINAYSWLAYVPDGNGLVTLRSENYPGQIKFNLHQIPENIGSFRDSYARAATLALNEDMKLERGIYGIINEMLPGCGLMP